MKKIVFIFTVLSTQFTWAQVKQQTRIGLFYEIGKKNENYIFKQETKVKIESDDDRTTEAIIWDAQGNVLMREFATVRGGITVSQTVEQLQINEKYTLAVDGKIAIFRTFDTKNKNDHRLIEQAERKIDGQFITGPSLEIFIKKHLDKIKNNDVLQVNFGIFEIQKALSFEVRKIDKVFGDLPSVVPVKMKLDSLFSLFVDPLLFEVDADTAVLHRYRGRTPVRVLKKGKLVPFDGDIYYEVQK